MLNEKNLTPELLEKAKSATSAEALLALAQENDITLSAEEAATYYTKLHPETGALSDEELDNVAGAAAMMETHVQFVNLLIRQADLFRSNVTIAATSLVDKVRD